MTKQILKDEDFDERGILRDGHTLRVPLMMCDSLQRSVALADANNAPMHVVDGQGSTDGLNRPGSRHLIAGKRTTDWARIVTANIQRDQARDQMINDMQTAWQQDIASEFRGAQPGDPCTVRKGGYRGYAEGSPGHLDENLECIPDQRPRDAAAAQRIRDAAYEQSVRELTEAWKQPVR